jgi:ADP-heptose:LPS heptosyltransferase
MIAFVNSILIIVLDNLGDTVMATAVVPALKTLNPRIKIGFWVKEYAAGALRNEPQIQAVHASDPFWDKAPGRGKGNLNHFLKTIGEIRAMSYDAALILNTEWRRSLAAKVAGIPVRIGYRRRKSGLLLTHSIPFEPQGHIVDDHLALLSEWSGTVFTKEKYFPHLDVRPAERKKWITLHPFSGDPERKNWPIVSWRALIENLSHSLPEYSYSIVGGASDEPEVKKLCLALPGVKIAPFVDRPLSELLDLLAKSRLFVGGDSGPGHMAAAIGTPVLSLFGSFDPARCRPLGSNTIEVLRHQPIKELPVAAVEKKMKEMLL